MAAAATTTPMTAPTIQVARLLLPREVLAMTTPLGWEGC